MKRLALFMGSIALGAACGGGGGTSEQKSTNPPPLASSSASVTPPVNPGKDVAKLAAEAFVFGYPALFMERQKRSMTTNVRLPLGVFAHASKLPRAEDADVLPSVDTLLSSAWLELHNDGAWSLKLPDMGDRWYAIEMFDAYGQPIGVVGKKTTGTKAQQVVITGPEFKGNTPPGAHEIKSTTSTVWLVGRTRVLGDSDLARASALLKVWALTPLAPATAPTQLPPAPLGRPQDLKFGGPEMFDELGEILKSEPPPADVAAVLGSKLHSLDEFAKVGIGPGLTPSKTLSQEQLATLAQGIKDGAEQIEQALEKLATRKNGWDLDATFGQRGGDPTRQAAAVLRGLDWPVASEGLVYIARVDDGDRVLSGAHEYAIHFAKAPPAKSYWNLTMYSARSGGLVPGAKRWALNDGTAKKNADGSVDVTIQSDAPAKNESNWLPAPKGEGFMVVLRLYEPADGAASWDAPPVKRIK